ncbi:hypothetical protein RF11_13630 [Thelohanellus kitauei]|uniref:Uncharacterized protein n=1 Tax=Thelohanellus kitauei TaxID=669202 RepID=A0A0C2JVU8_THEKT|nr:hypothetical protein RF11_13630 [Thelohanellus kitauei]
MSICHRDYRNLDHSSRSVFKSTCYPHLLLTHFSNCVCCIFICFDVWTFGLDDCIRKHRHSCIPLQVLPLKPIRWQLTTEGNEGYYIGLRRPKIAGPQRRWDSVKIDTMPAAPGLGTEARHASKGCSKELGLHEGKPIGTIMDYAALCYDRLSKCSNIKVQKNTASEIRKVGRLGEVRGENGLVRLAIRLYLFEVACYI